MIYTKEFESEIRNDPTFVGRLILIVWLPSAVGVLLVAIAFILLLFSRDNAMCE